MGNYKQLIIEERSFIQSQLTLEFKPSWIAVGLGRSISTISLIFAAMNGSNSKRKLGAVDLRLQVNIVHCWLKVERMGCQPNLWLKDDCKVAMCFGKRYGLFKAGLLTRANCWHT